MENEMINVNFESGSNTPTVSGRELHKKLEVKTAYKDWFPRMCEYGFTESVDFNPLKNEQVRSEGGRKVCREVTDHQLTIQMAKEICMIQRTDIGRMFRRYFISIEEKWNDPEMVMARALKLADKKIVMLENKVGELEAKNSLLVADTLTWADRPLLNAIIRKYAKTAYVGSEFAFAYAWTDFKKELLYKYGVNINSRITEYLNKSGKKTKPKTLDMLTDDEVVSAFKTVLSMCEDCAVDISELLDKGKKDSLSSSMVS